MKTLLVWSGGVVPAYWEFFSALGKRMTLRVLAPRRWVHGSTSFRASHAPPPDGFEWRAAGFWPLGGGRYFIPGLAPELIRFQPDIVYFMDEADRAATWAHLAIARWLRPAALRVNYNLQNLASPSYHAWHHRFFLRRNRALLQGTIAAGAEAEAVLKTHGYQTPTARIPLFASEKDFFPASPVDKANLRRRLGVPDRRILLVYAGSLARAKGVDMLLQAAPKHPALYLLLAGAGELEAEARALPSASGKLLGTLPLFKLRELYQAGDCIILPSRDTPAWKEQIGRVLLESILCGCLGLGSDSGFIPELLDTPETVCSQGSPEALNTLLGGLPLPQSHKLWERQRSRVRRQFSASAVAQATADFLESLGA